MAQPLTVAQARTECAQHGFPAMMDSSGNKIANGEFLQWTENGNLHITIDYDFGNGHLIKEQTSLRQTPRLIQEEWSWTESMNGQTLKHFEVNFGSGKAIAEKWDGHKMKRWSDDLKIEPGRTFAGIAFVFAIKQEYAALKNGGKIQLHAVGFTPKPRVVSVDISHDGLYQMNMADRIVRGDGFTIHPEVPAFVKRFVDVKDSHIWLSTPPAIGFLRWEGSLVETSDPVIRVDFLPGQHSGTAVPISNSSQNQSK